MSNILPTPALPGSGSRDRKRHYASTSQPDLCPAPLLFYYTAICSIYTTLFRNLQQFLLRTAFHCHEKQLEFHSAVEILPGFVINIFIPEELSLLLRRSQSLCQVPEDRWLLHCRRSDHTSYIASRSPTLLHRRASRWQTDCPRHIFRGDKPS